MVARLTSALVAIAVLVSACGGDDDPPLPEAIPIGTSGGHRLPPLSEAVRAGEPVDGMRCSTRERRRYGVHVELFGDRHSAIFPAGIGIAPPHSGRRPYVVSGRCSYPLRTREPTGVIEIAPQPGAPQPTLGDLFALWGQPLTRTQAAQFRGPVKAWLDGRRWTREPGELPLGRHAQVVIVVGPDVPVHDDYLFPPGL